MERLEVFAQPWLEAWLAQLNSNDAYRKAAAAWEDSLMLVMEADTKAGIPLDRVIWLDLWHGRCRSGNLLRSVTERPAVYIISAEVSCWQAIFDRRLDPILGLMGGKLKLKAGNLLKLVRFSSAARQLVLSAIQVPTYFPNEKVAAPPPVNLQTPQVPIAQPHFITTRSAGLQHNSFPMRLYHKAKRLGIWNPQDIDFHQDRLDWQKLAPLEKEVLLHLTTLFQAGEESVTLDLLPLILTIARERRLEEEMYLTTFLWEEAKHTEFFRRFIDDVAGETQDLDRFYTPSYNRLFGEELPKVMNALLTDASPAAQIRASVTYNMIVEGMLAETGYHAYFSMLERNGIMPGLQQGIYRLKEDESRHIAYGLYLLSRLIAANPALWETLELRMGELLEVALTIINEIFDCYDIMPFGLQIDHFVDYGLGQFKSRLARLEKARHQTATESIFFDQIEA